MTIEFVLWIPLFAALLMIAVDASTMYMTSTRMENAARDATRRVSIGQIGPAAVPGYVQEHLSDGPYSVTTECSTADYACVRIDRPVASIVTFKVLGALLQDSLTAETRMRLEPGIVL